jgi:hypothetical protein
MYFLRLATLSFGLYISDRLMDGESPFKEQIVTHKSIILLLNQLSLLFIFPENEFSAEVRCFLVSCLITILFLYPSLFLKTN